MGLERQLPLIQGAESGPKVPRCPASGRPSGAACRADRVPAAARAMDCNHRARLNPRGMAWLHQQKRSTCRKTEPPSEPTRSGRRPAPPRTSPCTPKCASPDVRIKAAKLSAQPRSRIPEEHYRPRSRRLRPRSQSRPGSPKLRRPNWAHPILREQPYTTQRLRHAAQADQTALPSTTSGTSKRNCSQSSLLC